MKNFQLRFSLEREALQTKWEGVGPNDPGTGVPPWPLTGSSATTDYLPLLNAFSAMLTSSRIRSLRFKGIGYEGPKLI